ncbi:MAG: hypothetical protein QHH04_07785 [Methanolinea sp.]|jgi:uncharacterized protein YlxP (DUF503 family)|nr:hypothetical protein [Methanolinea sp.]
MFKKVRDLLAPGKNIPPREISLDEIPAIIGEEERSWREELQKRMDQPREKFTEVSSTLLIRVTALGRSERDSVYHPKIEKITRNSIPQFEKAITTSLSRQAPPDPAAFYQVATESLKGCVKALAGPGRYLGTVFPDQMKEVKVLIDELGHQVNAMTPLIAEDKRRSRSYSRARESFLSIREKQAALAEAREKLSILEARERDLATKQDELAREKEECDRRAGMDGALQDAVRDKGLFSERVAEIGREIHGTTSPLIHVFAKAEKILQKRSGGEKEIKRVIDLLSLEGGKIDEGLVERVKNVLPLVISMVNAGDIHLKNQEEINFFSNPDRICPALASLVNRRKEAESDLRKIEEFIRSHPAVKRAGQVEKFIKEIVNDREKIGTEIVNTREGIRMMEKEIPERIHDLEAVLRELFAGSVRLKV